MQKRNFNSSLESFPLPDYLQRAMERNIGRPPVWKFPQILPTPDGLTFEKLNFESRYHLIETFQNDTDEWVDERFKSTAEIYEYVAMLCIEMPYSFKHGGCDWLVFSPDGTCAGILHSFEFSKEQFDYHHRRCAIGFVFSEKFRGSSLTVKAVQHFQQFLFGKMNLLYLLAWTDTENIRCCRFLEKLGWFDCPIEYENDSPKYRFYELYRSKRTQIMLQRKRSNEV